MAIQNKLTDQQKPVPFQQVVKNARVQQNIAETLGDISKAKTFTASIITAVSMNRELAKCDPISIINAALNGEVLNLSPQPQFGHYYMVPFNQKYKDENGQWQNKKVATWQIGYKGYIQLAIRSGQYRKIIVNSIKEGELIEWNPLTEDIKVDFIGDDDVRDAAPTMGYYANFELVNGFKKAMYWSYKHMTKHAETYAPSFRQNGGVESLEKLKNGQIPQDDMWKYSSFWFKDFDGMAHKTMLRQLISKWGIMSVEMQMAYVRDYSFKETLDDSEALKYGDDVIDADVSVPSTEPQESLTIEEQPPQTIFVNKTERVAVPAYDTSLL